jgi:hypothetical protein
MPDMSYLSIRQWDPLPSILNPPFYFIKLPLSYLMFPSISPFSWEHYQISCLQDKVFLLLPILKCHDCVWDDGESKEDLIKRRVRVYMRRNACSWMVLIDCQLIKVTYRREVILICLFPSGKPIFLHEILF